MIAPTCGAVAQASAAPQPQFVHHVFFYLKRPGNVQDKARLAAALERLARAPTIRSYQVGEHAGTTRAVIERGYDLSWTLTFDSAADQEAYQVDPIHLDFVRENEGLWSRVVVYDTVPVTR
ncbi:Dabb family protein [Sphingomonas sp.]|uniref:Dabb family protein n=1 Tax=Sphingomonas sp. TaxID=28214 RepID=UPI002BA46908|nr:Dabb family protein [Sphingomonas sp.]HTG37315.1 Dabb family protein [Sphingomonas sp.]